MKLKARSRGSDQRTRVQDDTQAGIAEHEMKIVVSLSIGALGLHVSPHCARETEQAERLVNQMRTQVIEDACSWLCSFSPAIAHQGTGTIIMSFIGGEV